jgi:hypothetical protein
MNWKLETGSGKLMKRFPKHEAPPRMASPRSRAEIKATDLAAAVSIMEDRTPCV